MEPLKVVVVEDHPLIRRHIVELVVKNRDFVVGEAGSVQEGKELIRQVKFDLLLLDIELPGGTGFDILKDYPEPFFYTVFLTAYREYAIQAIKNGVIDYVLKPVNEEELYEAIKKTREKKGASILSQEETLNSKYLSLKHLNKIQLLPIDEIAYCQGEASYTKIFMSDGRKILTSKYLKAIELKLPENKFFRTHQSYLINREFINEYQREGIILLKNGIQIPVSTRSRIKLLDLLSKM